MNLNAARSSLGEIEDELRQVLERRERILKNSRDVILACSRAIIAVHAGKRGEAAKDLEDARAMLQELRRDGRSSLARYLQSPEAEFVEASAVVAISKGRSIPDVKSLEVSHEAYLLGLLDTVGELKRLLLVALTSGEVKRAEQYFQTMEDLYALLSSFAVYDNVVNGVRRKIDVARMITEDTRGILAEEARRESLLSSIEKLQRAIRRKDDD